MEPYLVKLRDGQTTIVEMTTGVHIVRLVKYEESYQRKFNKEVQVEIRNKLRSELFERERKYLIRELRTRADIVIIAD
jgi:ribosomal protein L31E